MLVNLFFGAIARAPSPQNKTLDVYHLIYIKHYTKGANDCQQKLPKSCAEHLPSAQGRAGVSAGQGTEASDFPVCTYSPV